MADEKNVKMKAGDIRVTLEQEETLWMDRKRVTVFALPWSFTKYTITPSKLTIATGFLHRREEEVRLYRIKDITFEQSLIERMNGTGTLKIISTDASVPVIQLLHIKKAKLIKDVISQAVEVARRANGVRTSEVIGNMPGLGGHMHGEVDPDAAAALGPELHPDLDGNGIPDCME